MPWGINKCGRCRLTGEEIYDAMGINIEKYKPAVPGTFLVLLVGTAWAFCFAIQ